MQPVANTKIQPDTWRQAVPSLTGCFKTSESPNKCAAACRHEEGCVSFIHHPPTRRCCLSSTSEPGENFRLFEFPSYEAREWNWYLYGQYKWDARKWQSCRPDGLERRQVTCRRMQTGLAVADLFCTSQDAKPIEEQACTPAVCPTFGEPLTLADTVQVRACVMPYNTNCACDREDPGLTLRCTHFRCRTHLLSQELHSFVELDNLRHGSKAIP